MGKQWVKWVKKTKTLDRPTVPKMAKNDHLFSQMIKK